MTTQNLVHGGDSGRWEQAIYAFLAEKERRSGSFRTAQGYSRMLYRFFRTLASRTSGAANVARFHREMSPGDRLGGRRNQTEAPVHGAFSVYGHQVRVPGARRKTKAPSLKKARSLI